MLARDLEYIDTNVHAELNIAVNEVKKMLVGFHRSLAR